MHKLKIAWQVVRRNWGWTGVGAGLAAGVALTLFAVQVVAPRFAETGWESGELVVLSGADESAGGQRDQLISRWNAMGGGRPKARLETVEGDANQHRAEMVKRAQGDGPAVDIYNLDVILMEEFRRFGYIRELDESLVTGIEGFLANPMRTCRDSNGRLWALPFNTDAGLLYYRDDLEVEVGTLNSLPALGGAIRDVFAAGGAQLRAGYAGQLAEYEGLTVNALEAIWAAGGQVVDDDGDVVIDSPQARNGIKWLAEGLREGNPQIILPDSRTFAEPETAEAFAAGQVAFMRNWPVWHNWLMGKVSFQVAPVPGRSVLGGQNLAIAANSDQPRAAHALIDFLTGELSQQILFERGGLAATRASIYQDSAIQERYPYAGDLHAAINGADLRPRTAYYAAFSEVFARGIRDALDNGGELPANFADDLADALRGIRH